MREETRELPVISRFNPKEVQTIYIPQCCKEGWDSCKHVVNKEKFKPKKRNIGL